MSSSSAGCIVKTTDPTSNNNNNIDHQQQEDQRDNHPDHCRVLSSSVESIPESLIDNPLLEKKKKKKPQTNNTTESVIKDEFIKKEEKVINQSKGITPAKEEPLVSSSSPSSIPVKPAATLTTASVVSRSLSKQQLEARVIPSVVPAQSRSRTTLTRDIPEYIEIPVYIPVDVLPQLKKGNVAATVTTKATSRVKSGTGIAPVPVEVITGDEEVEVHLPIAAKKTLSYEENQRFQNHPLLDSEHQRVNNNRCTVWEDPAVCGKKSACSHTPPPIQTRRSSTKPTSHILSNCNNQSSRTRKSSHRPAVTSCSKPSNQATAFTTPSRSTRSIPIIDNRSAERLYSPQDFGLPELQYSGSFNSKSTSRSKSSVGVPDKDYSEEYRLYLSSRSSSSEYTSTNIPALKNSNSHCSTRSTYLADSQTFSHHSQSQSLSLSQHNKKSKSYRHHRSHTVPETHRSKFNTSFISCFLYNNMNMKKKTHTLSAHSNLGDLISASKKMQQSKQQQQQREESLTSSSVFPHHTGMQPGVAQLGTSPSGLSSSNMYLSQAASGAGNGNGKLARPSNLSMASKAKSTGMLLSHPSIVVPPSTFTQDPSQQAPTLSQQPNTMGFPSQTTTPFQYPASISPPSRMTHPLTATSTTAPPPLSTTTSMNPFEDPKLIGDLQNIQNSNNPASDPFAQFDPLSSSQSSSQFKLQRPPSTASTATTTTKPPMQIHHQPSPSIDTAQLSELAAALSSLKPQQPNANDINNDTHVNNNGKGTGVSGRMDKSHRRFLSLRGPKSMNNEEMKIVMENFPQQNHSINGDGSSAGESGGDGKKKDKKDKRYNHKRAASMGILKRNEKGGFDYSRPITPIRVLGGKNKNQSSNSNSPNVCNNNNNNGSNEQEEDARGKSPTRRKLSLLRGKGHSRNNSAITPNHSPSKLRNSQLETITSNDSSDLYKAMNSESSSPQNTEIKIRSSEHDPSPHQISLPQASDVLMQAKLCRLMERYREIDQNFNFGVLANVSRPEMELFMESKPPKSPQRQLTSAGNPNLSPPTLMETIPTLTPTPISSLLNLAPAHKPIVETILTCANDLVLSAFYYGVDRCEKNVSNDSSQEISPGERIEVAIFASDQLRQFIVVYQGSVESQLKPIRNRFGKFKSKPFKNFGNEKNLTVFPPFQQGYSQSGVEEKVFQKLDALAEQHPFFDVIVTGHSYGATLALLGGMRYACSRPAMMVSCYAFGCPKVGAMDFRHYVNSLPNLKVVRMEYGFDKWVHSPDNPTWTHVGHTISILPQQQRERIFGGNEKSAKEHNVPQGEFFIRAYKFENDRPDSSNGKFIGKKGNKQENKIDHDISSYLNALEVVAKEGISWPRQFVGEEGTGVRGLNKEKRLVC